MDLCRDFIGLFSMRLCGKLISNDEVGSKIGKEWGEKNISKVALISKKRNQSRQTLKVFGWFNGR